MSARSMFERLLTPTAALEFARARDDRPVILELLDATWLSEIWATAVHLLTGGLLAPDLVRIVKDGLEVPSQEYTTTQWVAGCPVRLLDQNKIESRVGDGCTLLLTALERVTPAAVAASTAMRTDLNAHQCDMNGYDTPAASIGFRAHHDPQDVLVCQLRGAKSWQLFEPLEPLPYPSEYGRFPPNQVGALRMETRLSVGQALYIPRGWGHCAAAEDSGSHHITIGWTPVTVDEALHLAGEPPIGGLGGRRSAALSRARLPGGLDRPRTNDNAVDSPTFHSSKIQSVDFFGSDYVDACDAIRGENEVRALVDLIVGKKSPASLRVLDLGCGFGRIAVALGQAGVGVVGVDRSEDLLDVARSRADDLYLPHVEFLMSDLRTVDPALLGGASAFDAVIFVDSVLGSDTAETDTDLLRLAATMLRPNGRVFVEQLNPYAVGRYVRADGTTRFRTELAAPGAFLEDEVMFDGTSGTLHTLRHLSRGPSDRKEAELEVRLRTVREWREFACSVNLYLVDASDLDGAPLTLDSPRMVMQFQKAAEDVIDDD